MNGAAATQGVVGRIPIRNLWLLMLYASRLYREIPTSLRYAVEENPDDIPNLVAEVLTRAVERRLRRNLSYDFQARRADLTRVRGRIDQLRTERHYLLQRGKIACSFDELTTDTPQNRFVKAALQELTKIIHRDLTRRCRTAITGLERAGVRSELSLESFRRGTGPAVTASRTNSEDQQMMAAAQLALNMNLPTENPGSSRLPAPDRDEIWARRLFEAAVGGFYDTVLSPQGWKVRTGSSIAWQTEQATVGMTSILPSMRTDIVLERPELQGQENRFRSIIDTKFTHILSHGQYGQPSLRSGYIYQIYAYLRSQERDDDPPSLNASGMLLHPAVDADIDEAVTIQGHRIRFATVNLAADSQSIRRRLLVLANMDLRHRVARQGTLSEVVAKT